MTASPDRPVRLRVQRRVFLTLAPGDEVEIPAEKARELLAAAAAERIARPADPFPAADPQPDPAPDPQPAPKARKTARKTARKRTPAAPTAPSDD